MALATPVPASSFGQLAASRVCDRLARRVLAVVSVVALLTFRDYGLGWDDYAHAEYGDLLLAFYASGLRDQRALSWVNLYNYGGGFDLLAALAAKVAAVHPVRDPPAHGRGRRSSRTIASSGASAGASAGRARASLRSSCSLPARSTTATCS